LFEKKKFVAAFGQAPTSSDCYGDLVSLNAETGQIILQEPLVFDGASRAFSAVACVKSHAVSKLYARFLT
jgi:hypothetical protein